MKLLHSLLLSGLLIACQESDDNNMETHNHDMHDHGDHNAAEPTEGPVISMNELASVTMTVDQEELFSGADYSYTASLMFFDKDGTMINGVSLTEAQPWMMTMGHGSITDQLDFHQHDDMGHMWMVTGVQFSMPGEAGSWVLKTKFSYNGSDDEVHLPFVLEIK